MESTLLVAVVNAILSILVGMVLWGVRTINMNLTRLNGRLADHVENKDLHYAAQARTDEQLRSLLQTVEKAHERIDRVEAQR